MKLFFLRHGIAGESGEWHGNDFDRPLTDEGKRLMAIEATFIAGMAQSLDLLIASPLVRAFQTAEIIARKLDMLERLSTDDRLGPEFDAKRLAGILADHTTAEALMLVGHEPSLGRTIGSLIGGGLIEMKKGALACVKLEHAASSRGELAFLLPPSVLMR